MGAEKFQNRVSGTSAIEAFRSAREKALYEYGHRGYTGTIAEKTEFQMETPRAGESPTECVRRCSSDQNHFSDDKWGPAACVELGPDDKIPGNRIFVFFGWASS